MGDAQRRWHEELAADLAPREGERMTQAQVLRALNETATPDDWLVVAAGTPPWTFTSCGTPPDRRRARWRSGFSCMGGEIPAALGVRMAKGGTGEVYVVIGDGT